MPQLDISQEQIGLLRFAVRSALTKFKKNRSSLLERYGEDTDLETVREKDHKIELLDEVRRKLDKL